MTFSNWYFFGGIEALPRVSPIDIANGYLFTGLCISSGCSTWKISFALGDTETIY